MKVLFFPSKSLHNAFLFLTLLRWLGLNRNGKSRHPFLIPYLKENASTYYHKYAICCRVFVIFFIRLMMFLSILICWDFFLSFFLFFFFAEEDCAWANICDNLPLLCMWDTITAWIYERCVGLHPGSKPTNPRLLKKSMRA